MIRPFRPAFQSPARLRRSLAALVPSNTRTALRSLRCDLITSWLSRIGSRPFQATSRPALVFAPHQDDETLGCGGMISLKRALGAYVGVVFLTGGEKSHLGDPDTAPIELARLRRQEALDALDILGVSDVHFLNHPDSGLRYQSPDERRRLIDEITGILRKHQPKEVFVPHRADVHEDHEETYKLVLDAIRQVGISPDVYQYSIWMLWWRNTPFIDLKPSDIRGAYRLSLGTAIEDKRNALGVYQSQGKILTDRFLRRFYRPEEIFFHQ